MLGLRQALRRGCSCRCYHQRRRPMQPLAAPPAASLRAGAAAGSASPWPGHRRSYTRTARQPLGVAAPSSSTTAAALRQTLGAPIPLNEHAVSVTMPKWSHVVGYEEGDPAVTDRLVLGYPRFVYHPFVKQLVEVWKQQAVERGELEAHEEVGALPFPSQAAAERCRRFLLDAHAHEPGFPVRVHSLDVADAHMVSFPAAAAGEAKAYWQHAGEILSSRKAQHVLTAMGHTARDLTGGFPLPAAADYGEGVRRLGRLGVTGAGEVSAAPTCYRQALRARLAQLTGQDAKDVQLTISGMAAIFKAFHICKEALPGRKVVVFGFTYLDTLKICLRKEWNAQGVHFLGRGDEKDLKALKEIVRGERIMGLFTEFPSNPLLQNPDLGQLSALGREHGFPMVVDDTISNFHNVDLLRAGPGGVDMSCTSLTKLFSGKGDVMAGALVMNGHSPLYPQLRAASERVGGEDAGLYEADAEVTFRNGQDFEARSQRINATTDALVDWLAAQPGVRAVFYPRLTQRPIYDAYKRPEGGYGGLFSVSLEEGLSPTAFYDALDVYKGPSLGTNYTLACPYTLLAHYSELDFAKAHGVCPNLVRVSVGLEEVEHLKHVFAVALEAAKKPPPPDVCPAQYFPAGLYSGSGAVGSGPTV